jgi:hypothetical protein
MLCHSCPQWIFFQEHDPHRIMISPSMSSHCHSCPPWIFFQEHDPHRIIISPSMSSHCMEIIVLHSLTSSLKTTKRALINLNVNFVLVFLFFSFLFSISFACMQDIAALQYLRQNLHFVGPTHLGSSELQSFKCLPPTLQTLLLHTPVRRSPMPANLSHRELPWQSS